MSEEQTQETNDGTWSGLKKTIVGTLTTVIAGGGVWMSTLLFGGSDEEPKEETKTEQAAPAQAPVIVNVQQNQENKQKTENNNGGGTVVREKIIEKPAQQTQPQPEKPKKVEVVKEDSAQPTVTIQDRIREKAHECIGELEGQFDDYVLSGFKTDVSPFAVMHTLNIKGVHVGRIVDFAKSRRSEFDEVLNTDDKELKEAYSNFTKPQLKKIIGWCDQVILDAQKVMGEAQQNRKPRKRKQKSAEELVAKIKVLAKYDDLKLVGVPTKDIIGALQIWVYNVKQRKLGCYHADDAGGFSVKGTTITNFSESKSIQKRLRKPEVTLPEVLKGGKVALRNLLDGVKAVEAPLTGRLNSDTILVRILK